MKNVHPHISIVIPTFNRAHLLSDTLTSIQNQSIPSWEIHIVDDGSTDHTRQIVEKFKKDTRINYYFQKKSGVASARNYGMNKAKGEIITFIDSDDPVYSIYLEQGIHHLSQNNKTFALSNCDFFYELYDTNGNLLSRKPQKSAPASQITLQAIYNWEVHVAIGTGLFIKKFFLGKTFWNPDIIPGDDIEFVMQLACVDPEGFVYIHQALFEYRQKYGGDGICSNTSYQQWSTMFQKIYDLHKNDLLMSKPNEYLSKINKYKHLQTLFEKGEVVPPQFKYFPELWDFSRKNVRSSNDYLSQA